MEEEKTMFDNLTIGDKVLITEKEFIKDKNSSNFAIVEIKEITTRRIYINHYNFSFDRKTGLRIIRKNESYQNLTVLRRINNEIDSIIDLKRDIQKINNMFSFLLTFNSRDFNNLSSEEITRLKYLLKKLKK